MAFDPLLSLAGVLVGFLVGLTGMGGGALLTPILVLFFNISPLAAVSSDLIVSLITKPVSTRVHARKGTVNWPIVRWLLLGSVPCAFAGVIALRQLGLADNQDGMKLLLGCTMATVASLTLLRSARPSKANTRDGQSRTHRPLATTLLGCTGGLIVGMTSVGSGSLIVVGLLLLYPSLSSKELVGTDLAQAIPLVASASAGHLLFGDFQIGIAGSLLIGTIPGAYLGAHLCTRMSDGHIRNVIVVMLFASASKLLGLTNVATIVVAAMALTVQILTRKRERKPRPSTAFAPVSGK